MYFALMILIALAVIALVLCLEHRGDACLLEREYGPPQKLPGKGPPK
ncbi:MAG TPA: hypothetical protein VF723_09255 [Pyrinomonadaceae bacterium]|jgi:hypothetical protein